MLRSEQHAELVAHAATTANEVCGVLVGDGERVTRVVRCRNAAADRRAAGTLARSEATGYVIDPLDLLRVFHELEGSGERVVAYYHSHPGTASASPSRTDLADARATGEHRSALFVVVRGGEVRAFAIDDEGDAKAVEIVTGR